MTIIQAQIVGDRALLPRDEFNRLVEIARRCEEIELHILEGSSSAEDMTRLAEQAGAFDFWNVPGEKVYSLTDGDPV